MSKDNKGNQKMTKSQAIAAIASEIILWQSRRAEADVYGFGAAKELAEHLLNKGCDFKVFMPYQPPEDCGRYRDTCMWEDKED